MSKELSSIDIFLVHGMSGEEKKETVERKYQDRRNKLRRRIEHRVEQMADSLEYFKHLHIQERQNRTDEVLAEIEDYYNQIVAMCHEAVSLNNDYKRTLGEPAEG